LFISANQRRALCALAALAGLWAILALARTLLRAGDGLDAQYFANTTWSGWPSQSVVDPEPASAGIAARWNGAPPPAFSIIWTGYLAAPSGGRYTLATRSDDGSRLFVDGQLVVDNGGAHGPQTREARIVLTRGEHRVRLEFVELGAGYELAWLWARDDQALSPVPRWALSVRQAPLAAVLAVRVLDGTLTAVTVLVAVAAAWTATAIGGDPRTRTAVRRSVGRYRSAAAAAGAAAVWVALLATPWPGGGPPLFVTAVTARIRDLNVIASGALRQFSTLQHHVGTPHAGEEVLPDRVLAMVAMLDAAHVRQYQLSAAIAADAWVFQQMVATAWPRTLEPTAHDRFVLETDSVPPRCRRVDHNKDVWLVACP